MHTLTAFFGWPDGGIWSNLAASVVWTLPALGWHHRRMKRHIAKTLALPAAAPAPAAAPKEVGTP
jgi:hypothetical protein